MWTLINATKTSITVGDLTFLKGERHVVAELTKDIRGAVNNGQLYSDPAIPVLGAALTDSSGGTAANTIAAITEAGNVGSADTEPTANAIASLAAAVNNLQAVVDSY